MLEQYAQGVLTLDEVLAQLERQVRYILYCSEAAQPFRQAQLLDIVEEAQAQNETHGITGLRCYKQGHFMQFLEEPAGAVITLFDNIRRDARHHRVACLSDGAGPTRWFPNWRMALMQVNSREFYWLTTCIGSRRQFVLPRIPIRDLLILLHAFSQTRGGAGN